MGHACLVTHETRLSRQRPDARDARHAAPRRAPRPRRLDRAQQGVQSGNPLAKWLLLVLLLHVESMVTEIPLPSAKAAPLDGLPTRAAGAAPRRRRAAGGGTGGSVRSVRLARPSGAGVWLIAAQIVLISGKGNVSTLCNENGIMRRASPCCGPPSVRPSQAPGTGRPVQARLVSVWFSFSEGPACLPGRLAPPGRAPQPPRPGGAPTTACRRGRCWGCHDEVSNLSARARVATSNSTARPQHESHDRVVCAVRARAFPSQTRTGCCCYR